MKRLLVLFGMFALAAAAPIVIPSPLGPPIRTPTAEVVDNAGTGGTGERALLFGIEPMFRDHPKGLYPQVANALCRWPANDPVPAVGVRPSITSKPV